MGIDVDWDLPIVVLRWSDGSHNIFFKHDKRALKNYVKTKRNLIGFKMKYKTIEYKKSHYDRLNGL